jgi:hypothetical protein
MFEFGDSAGENEDFLDVVDEELCCNFFGGKRQWAIETPWHGEIDGGRRGLRLPCPIPAAPPFLCRSTR